MDGMRPPAETSFVIFLSSNSHFRVLVAVSFLQYFLTEFIIEFKKRLKLKKKKATKDEKNEKSRENTQQNTCLLVVNTFSSCPINCNVAFVYLNVGSNRLPVLLTGAVCASSYNYRCILFIVIDLILNCIVSMYDGCDILQSKSL